jgi:transposase InsO family protein
MAKRELDDLITQYARAHFDGRRTLIHALSWTRVGTVWAMDYTAPPTVIEGRYRTVLAVRDLASGNLLAAVPAERDNAQTTCEVLRALFAEHGAPLVMKSDNGGHFIAEEVRRLFEEFGVVHLRSPFYMPSFNGSIEAGIGSLKIRAHFEAARHDRPGEWTVDDVEAARLRGNELGFPNGRARGTPDAAWGRRQPITDADRRQLADVICRYRLAELRERGYQEGSPLGEDLRRSIERLAVARALCQLGFVQFRRRFIPLPINPGLRSRIA